MKNLTLLVICYCLSAWNLLNAQLVINEFSAANFNDFIDNYGEYEDWIELYNNTENPIDLGGYYLSDRLTNPAKWEIPAGVTIGAFDHLLIYASDRDEVSSGNVHASFKITQTKSNEAVVLANPLGTIIDSHPLDIPNQNKHSRGRASDGGSEWAVFVNATPGFANNNPRPEYTPTPLLSLDPGIYNNPVSVNISCADPDASIRYTLDGSVPNQSSTLYTQPVQINETTVLRAAAFSPDAQTPRSFIATNTYFIAVSHTVPILSISGGDGVEELLEGDYGAEPVGHLEYFDASGNLLDEVTGEYNKHGNDSWAYAQRGVDFIARDQLGYSYAVKSQIFPSKDRDEFQRLILKAAANDNYPFESGGAHIRDAYVHTLSQLADLELDERTYEACVLYLNGEYWGVYEIREKVDDNDFTDYYYNQGRKWLDFIKTWGWTWEEYGSWDDWYDLRAYIDNNDMTNDESYAYVEERLNVLSLIDYFILHSHNVSADWLNYNTGWWRGRKESGEAKKWRYILWDEDATFGHYINYTGIPDQSATADPCNPEQISDFTDFEGHVELFSDLFQNENFKSLYINRYADLNNSFFSCDYMLPLLDQMIARIAPEMPAHIDRWGGSLNGWESNVQELRDFISTRCTIIDDSILDCYEDDGITGPYQIKIEVEPELGGTVQVNNYVPEIYPWEGTYFGGTQFSLNALPAAGYSFSHWQVLNNIFSPDEFNEAIAMSLESDDEITAVFVGGVPCSLPGEITIDASPGVVAASWDMAAGALSYDFRFREAGTENWTNLSLLESSYTFNGLENCTSYEIEMRSICGFELSNFVQFTFESFCPVGTEHTEAVRSLGVYPNPFRETINVVFELAEAAALNIILTDIMGRITWSAENQFYPSGEQRMTITTGTDWPSGIYFLNITTGHKTIVKRIVK